MSEVNATEPSPFHKGEKQIQERLGVHEDIAKFARKVVRDYLPDQHRDFYRQLAFLVIGTVDNTGQPWASLATGVPGFITSPDPRVLNIGAPLADDDPAAAGIRNGEAVGLLGIELATRRRNRMNGTVQDVGPAAFSVRVDQSFGNCPQYIAAQESQPCARSAAPAQELGSWDHAAIAQITEADAFYVASYTDNDRAPGKRGVDVSHRGGKPGFVKIEEDGRLTIPDFTGNFHFNTLGNLLLNPRAGLVFADFKTGTVLQATGTTEIVWESEDVTGFRGAERLWRFKPVRIVRRPAALQLTSGAVEPSQNSLFTGSWEEATAKKEADAFRNQWRAFSVDRVVEESEVIRSFYLSPADGAGLPDWQPGQYLPMRVTLDGETLVRTYTISSAPLDGWLRISVKREENGSVSRHLHDEIQPGMIIEARAPDGQFVLDTAEMRPAVLISAGVGVTPMIAMLRQAVLEGIRTRRARPIWFFHAARTTGQRAFYKEAREIAKDAQHPVPVVSVIDRPGPDDVQNKHFDVHGRLSVDLLKQVLPFDDYDFFLCGPPGFMSALYNALRDLNVADARLHFEAFGSATVNRRPDIGARPEAQEAIAESAVVAFEQSGFEQRWTQADGSLLELAEAHGLTPPYGCRNGVCGTCAVPVTKGTVAYASQPRARVEDGHALLCCARPGSEGGTVSLQL